MTFHIDATDLRATDSSLAALVRTLSDPTIALSVGLWSDDDLSLAHVAITADGHALEAHVGYDAVGTDGPIFIEIPGLTESCKRALADAGVLPPHREEQIEASNQVEMAIAQTQGARIKAEILARLQAGMRTAATTEEVPSPAGFCDALTAPSELRFAPMEVRFADWQDLERLDEVLRRYAALTSRAPLPEFGPNEIMALAGLRCSGAWYLDDARFLDYKLEDAIAFNEIRPDVDRPALLAKVRSLDLLGRIALVERLEAWWLERAA